MSNLRWLRLSIRIALLLAFFSYTYIVDFHNAGWAVQPIVRTLVIFAIGFFLAYWSQTKPLLIQFVQFLRGIACKPEHQLVGFLAVTYFILTASLSQILFQGLPHVADTHSQYVHGKMIASGHFYLPSHRFSHFFDFQSMVNNGRYYSYYAPGHVLLLALGHVLGFVWLVNPLMGSLTIIALYLLTREIAGKTAGLIASALMFTSPFMVFMSSEYMNNVTCEFFLTMFLFCYIRQHKTNSFRYAVFAGLCVGYAFITRPQITLPFALPIAFHAIATFIKNPKERLAVTLALMAAFIFFVSNLLLYNKFMNDNPFIQSGIDPLHFLRPFLSWDTIRQHILGDFHRLRITVIMLHQHLLGWPTSSLLFVLMMYAMRAQKRYCGLIIACCLAQLASLIINPFYSRIFGPRYLYETSTCLIALTAIFLVRAPALWRSRLHLRCRLSVAHGAMATVIVMFFIMSFPTHTIDSFRIYNDNYFEGNETFVNKLMTTVEKPALVFFKEYYQFRWLYFTMPPLDDNPVIVAQNRGPNNKKLIDYYPNRTVYMVDKGVITKLSGDDAPNQ